MISKKKVTFEDVKDVLWELTDDGGMFNNMQEVLSESVKSKWKNLADAIDIMLGDIAERGLSVRDAEQRAQQLLHPPAPRSEARADPDVLRLAEEVSEKVGAKVSIRPGRKGSGKLVVEYATLDQLDNLIAALSGRQ
jgi:ParB-like chromosome segregation protein Spo0J